MLRLMMNAQIEPLNDFRSLNGVIGLNIRNGFISERKFVGDVLN